jgi:DNA polymerase-3 subunit gamma/tau
VYLIDEVHMLSTHSFNALLKTLEEPPPHVKFLLATTDPQKLPVTVLSRCLQFNLKRLPVALIAERMKEILEKEGIPFEPAGLRLVAQAADGSMRDGLSLLDQLIAFGNGRAGEEEARAMLGTIARDHVVRLAELLGAMNVPELLSCARSLEEFAPDYAQVLDELSSLFVRIAMKQALSDFEGDELYDPELLTRLARAIAPEDVQLFYQTAITGRRDLGLAPDPRSGFEMTLLRMIAFRPLGEVEQSRGGPSSGGGGSVSTSSPAGGGAAAARAAAAGGSGRSTPGSPRAADDAAPTAAAGGIGRGTPESLRAANDAVPADGGTGRGRPGSLRAADDAAPAVGGTGRGTPGSPRAADAAAPAPAGTPGLSGAAAARAAAAGLVGKGTPASGGTQAGGSASGRSAGTSTGSAAFTGGVAANVVGSAAGRVPSDSTANPATDLGEPWSTLIGRLELGGAARQLASNCHMAGRQGSVIRLALDARNKHMRTPAQEEKLAQALSRHFNQPIRLEFEMASGDIETPAKADQRASMEDLDAARRAFESDPGVQGLKERFGATLLPETIRPVK